VFPNSQVGLLEANNRRGDWRAFRERQGLGSWFTPYTFRRTVATLLTDKLPTREASDLLGHSKISQTTDTYVGRTIISRDVADADRVRPIAEQENLKGLRSLTTRESR